MFLKFFYVERTAKERCEERIWRRTCTKHVPRPEINLVTTALRTTASAYGRRLYALSHIGTQDREYISSKNEILVPYRKDERSPKKSLPLVKSLLLPTQNKLCRPMSSNKMQHCSQVIR